jgi:hypothetical protein
VDRQHSGASPGTIAVIRSFNRETEAFAALVVSAVVSTALLFAVLFQDRQPKSADLTEEARETGGTSCLTTIYDQAEHPYTSRWSK